MELKETIEELKLINEVNTKSLNELADEYLSNKEDANEFLQKYGFIFLRKPLYQLRVADKYEKILELFNYGNLMYPNEDNDFFDHNIKTMINYNLKAYDLRSKTDDLSQAQILFSNSLGADKCRKIPSFEELISGIYDASIKYDLKGKYSIEDYRTFLEVTTYNYDKKSLELAIEKYKKDHPLMQLCKDKNYLFFVNFMLCSKKDLVDKSFIDDSYDIIETSLILFSDSLKDKETRKDYKEYKKLAKFTINNIKTYEKENLKEDNKSRKLLH